MENPDPDYAVLLRAAQRRLVLAVFALCLGTGLLSWTKAYSDAKSGEPPARAPAKDKDRKS